MSSTDPLNADFAIEDLAVGTTAPEGASADFTFDDLVANEGGAVAPVDLSAETFGTIQVEDFSGFDITEQLPEEGEYALSVEQSVFRDAVATVGLSISKSSANFSTVRVGLQQNAQGKYNLRLQGFNQSAFTEVFVPLRKPPIPDVPKNTEISFISDYQVLQQIANTVFDATIEIRFKPGAEKELTFNAAGGWLPRTIYDQTLFTNYHAKIGEHKHLATFSPKTFGDAISYLRKFAKKDDVQQNLGLVEIGPDGFATGGQPAALARFMAPAVLTGFNVRVKFDSLDMLEKALARFASEEVRLYEAEHYYIIRDDVMFFGFEKSTFAFPNVNHIFKRGNDQLLVPRATLAQIIDGLSYMQTDRELLVNLSLTGAGTDAEFSLSAQETSGKKAVQRVPKCTRQARPGVSGDVAFPDWQLFVSLQFLKKAISAADSTYVTVEWLPATGNKGAVLIYDEEPTQGVETHTILAAQAEPTAAPKAEAE